MLRIQVGQVATLMAEGTYIGNLFEATRSRPDDPDSSSRSYERDPSLLTLGLKGLLCAYLAAHLLSIGSHGMLVALLRIEPIDEGSFEASASRERSILVLKSALLLVTGIVFLKWTARANRNVRAFGATGLRFSPSFAAGCHFIPVASLWKPYQAMREIWQASRLPTAWQGQPVSAILGVWWAFWVFAILADRLGAQLTGDARRIEDLIKATYILVAADVSEILVTLAALAVVASIDRMQRSWVAGRDEATLDA